VSVIVIFGVLLLAATLVSDLLHRTVVSATVIFLAGGLIAGPRVLDAITIESEGESLRIVVELALFSVLFTDGMTVNVSRLRHTWPLPMRALLLGMPLIVALTTVSAHLLTSMDWIACCLLGAVLAPTDPVFASSLIRRKDISPPMRDMLHIESGLNDGFALPMVTILILLSADRSTHWIRLVAETSGGALLGFALAAAAWALGRIVPIDISDRYRPFFILAVGCVVFGASELLGVNAFLAAFSAGLALGEWSKRETESFVEHGRFVTEALKLAAVLLFGSMIEPRSIVDVGVAGVGLALVVLVVARPLAILLVTVRSELQMPERLAAGWFGPKGFASVVFALLVLRSPVPEASRVFHLAALVVVMSMVAHSSTDTVIASRLARVRDDRRRQADTTEEKAATAERQ
jgi:NhaP-type Na+/H+ or K+/H+ antiporter